MIFIQLKKGLKNKNKNNQKNVNHLIYFKKTNILDKKET